MHPSLYHTLAQVIGSPILEVQAVSGGSINQCYKLRGPTHSLFCKINSATKFPHLFQKEANGLRLLGQHGIKVPEVIDCLQSGDQQLLLLEWIDEGEKSTGFWKRFGEQLAALHQVTTERFGLGEDNYMGSVPQKNQRWDKWTDFFIHQRLRPLVAQCADQRLLHAKHQQLFDRLYEHLPGFFEKEKPTLLHGDLWSGNFMCSKAAMPVLIDPAVYFGHRSVDLGMTTLFGGFAPAFYEAYHYHYPLPENYKDQWQLCNLYPLLIHLLLFGQGYRGQIEQTLQQFA